MEITDVPCEIFEKLLCYIYTGRVELLDDHAEGLLAAADKYGLIKLKQSCERCLLNQLSLESAPKLLKLAEMHCAADLKASATNLIKTQGIGLIQSIAEQKPDQFVQLICDLINGNQCDGNDDWTIVTSTSSSES